MIKRLAYSSGTCECQNGLASKASCRGILTRQFAPKHIEKAYLTNVMARSSSWCQQLSKHQGRLDGPWRRSHRGRADSASVRRRRIKGLWSIWRSKFLAISTQLWLAQRRARWRGALLARPTTSGRKIAFLSKTGIRLCLWRRERKPVKRQVI